MSQYTGSRTEWVEMSDRADAAQWAEQTGARCLWVADGVIAYARLMDEGETVADALAEFAAVYSAPATAVQSHEVFGS
jgi:hypothetical protein